MVAGYTTQLSWYFSFAELLWNWFLINLKCLPHFPSYLLSLLSPLRSCPPFLKSSWITILETALFYSQNNYTKPDLRRRKMLYHEYIRASSSHKGFTGMLKGAQCFTDAFTNTLSCRQLAVMLANSSAGGRRKWHQHHASPGFTETRLGSAMQRLVQKLKLPSLGLVHLLSSVDMSKKSGCI